MTFLQNKYRTNDDNILQCRRTCHEKPMVLDLMIRVLSGTREPKPGLATRRFGTRCSCIVMVVLPTSSRPEAHAHLCSDTISTKSGKRKQLLCAWSNRKAACGFLPSF